jgi:hypothetical protein
MMDLYTDDITQGLLLVQRFTTLLIFSHGFLATFKLFSAAARSFSCSVIIHPRYLNWGFF